MRLDMWLNFPKFKNSTKQPVSDPDYTLNIDLKGDDSILSPLLKLQGVPSTCVYARIHELGRYYFVRDARWLNNDIVEYALEVDALASHKATIGASTHFIERSSHSYNSMLNDTLLSHDNIIANKQTINVDGTVLGVESPLSSTGCYLVRIVAKSGGSATGINTYAISVNDLWDLLNYAYDFNNFNEFDNDIVKSVFNPFDYIIDVKWTPLTLNVFKHNDQKVDIKLGYWTTNAKGYIVTDRYITLLYEWDWNNITWYYNDFRKYDPNYTRVRAFLPAIGYVYFNLYEYTYSSLPVLLNMLTYRIDVMTGEATIQLEDRVLKGNFMAQVQLAQSSTDLAKITSDIVGGTASAFAGNPVTAGMSAIDVVTSYLHPPITSHGSQNSIAFLMRTTMFLDIISFESATLPTATCGRPLMEYRQISTIPGYIKCGNASLSISCTDTERETINNYLNGGFYYE